MLIRVSEDDTGCAPADSRFCAYDDDAFDGAPDGNTVCGFGATRIEAIREFLEKLDD